jgi:hypothetical protein
METKQLAAAASGLKYHWRKQRNAKDSSTTNDARVIAN